MTLDSDKAQSTTDSVLQVDAQSRTNKLGRPRGHP
jgi:hypothetical protein